MPRRPVRRPRRRNNKGKASKSLIKTINRVVKGKAETKMAVYYGGLNGTGVIADAVQTLQNQLISTNSTDIKRIIPFVAQGTDDNQRVGNAITPVSLRVNCKVTITPQGTTQFPGYQLGSSWNIVAVAYCLQHVSYKTYTDLSVYNQFTQLLKVGDATTTAFTGLYNDAALPVDKGYYKLLGKKVLPLRCSGSIGGATTPNFEGTNNNSDSFTREFVWDLTKTLPKKLSYPETGAAVATRNDPQNAAPFWCVGFYNMSGLSYGSAVAILGVQYTSILKFKDM